MILKDIKVSGWRSFSPEHPVTIPDLGRVNLLIGPNNVGKSNLGRFLVKIRDSLQHFHDVTPWSDSQFSNKLNMKNWADPLNISIPISEVDCWLRNTEDFVATPFPKKSATLSL